MIKCKKIICAVLSVCVILFASLSTMFTVFAEEEEIDTRTLADRISNLGQKKEEYEKILQKNAKEISDKEEYVKALTEKIKILSEKVTLTRESITNLTDSIATSQKEIDQANSDIEGQLDALCKRLRAIYMAGSASELEIILGAKSFSGLKMLLYQGIDAFELWCWRRLLRVPWTARRSNQSILKEISPRCSLEGMMLKLKLQYFGHLMRRVDSLEKTLMLGGIGGRRRRGRHSHEDV